MEAESAYRWLMEAGAASARDSFDLHVVASILAISIADAKARCSSLALTSGLDGGALERLAGELFPAAAAALSEMAGNAEPQPEIEEISVIEILTACAGGSSDLVAPLAALVARRCLEPRHLWQDLGLRNRGELSRLMTRHFPDIKARNSGDMKWKKFLYRMVCAAEGFLLCPAPVCSECDDFVGCFGDEEGVAQLSHANCEDRL